MAQQVRGGARPNAGRKEVIDKLMPLRVSIRESRLNKLGGADVVQKFLKNYLDSSSDEKINPNLK